MAKKKRTPQCLVVSEICLGAISLMCGCVIYLLFRSKSLNIYKWCSAIGLSDNVDEIRKTVTDWNLPDWVRFSLPDGLYCAAYLLLIDAIWRSDTSWRKYIILSVVPIVTVGSEVLQYFGLVKGTFDFADLLCYALPPLFYLMLISINNTSTNV